MSARICRVNKRTELYIGFRALIFELLINVAAEIVQLCFSSLVFL